ncbi:MAG: cation:proton antiporter, partial [Acidobacteriota bacterium]
RHLLATVDFSQVLMEGMLSILLFAGALHIDIADLARGKSAIGILATVGVLLSTLLVGAGAWAVLELVGLELPFLQCLVFGALISPTDPIAVMGILKSAHAPRSLAIKIAGESLFNDGVGVVVFTVLLGLAVGGRPVTAGTIALLFAEEALGGIAYGLLIGYVAYRLLKSIDSYQVEILITLALVLGGSGLAHHLHVSGPIAMVVAGLLIGNPGRAFAMSPTTVQHLDTFWELLDEILNSVLFVLIGLEVLVLTFRPGWLAAALLMIPVVLLARFASVGIPVALLRHVVAFSPHAVKILTWAGVRGGISVALALSLPASPARETFVPVTYVVVLFSILVQGLTLGRLVRRTVGTKAAPPRAGVAPEGEHPAGG